MSLQNDGWKPLNVVLKPTAATAMRSYSILFYNSQEDHDFKRSLDSTTKWCFEFSFNYERAPEFITQAISIWFTKMGMEMKYFAQVF